jgi:ceramide synthetase
MEVNTYIWRKRRKAIQNRKIVKFVEAVWRFIFYLVFEIVGYYTLVKPELAPWLVDTTQHWEHWPLHELTGAIRFYYQVELGCYIHQLMWTEVSRSDAMEMMIHHITAILLISLSYLTNYTRVGTSILFLHDAADIFLESAKIFNYTSKAPGRAWAKVLTDVFFATFAVIFFITRLVIYPRFIVSSVLFEAPLFFGTDWIGFWIFAGLLIILQCLHVFWFYLIGRMIFRLVTTGIDKDERSDDEDEGEDPSSSGGGKGRGKREPKKTR